MKHVRKDAAAQALFLNVLRYNDYLAASNVWPYVFEREQRIRRMNLQWLRHGNCTRTGMRGAGLALAALMISTWTGVGASAWAQVATRIQLEASRTSSGTVTSRTFVAEVRDVAGNPVSRDRKSVV